MTSGVARVGDVDLAYQVEGPRGAPALVFAGSLGTTATMWAPQVLALRGRYRTVTYDARGHGSSGAPAGPYTVADLGGDVVGLLDTLGIARASLCGLSLGGMAAMWVAAHAPDRVDRLVLACTAPELGPAARWIERAAAVRASGTAAILPALAPRWFTPEFAIEHGDVLDGIEAMLVSCSDEGYASCCEAIATMDLADDVRTISAPTLVIAGAADPVTPPAVALALALAIPGASLAVIPGASHLANLEQPARFTAALDAHLGGDAAERGAAARRAVVGDAHVDRAERQTTGLTAANAAFAAARESLDSLGEEDPR